MKIIKRDKREEEFNGDKIYRAIQKANDATIGKPLSDTEIRIITDDVISQCKEFARAINIEEIQDIVENELMDAGANDVAKNYIVYRYERMLARNTTTLEDKIVSIVELQNEEVLQENSNKNPIINSTQRDYIAGEVSRDISLKRFFPKDVVEAHNRGIIHIHDTDYMVHREYNCCLVNLEDMLQNGTVISDTLIEKPHSFSTACNVATQIVAQVASNQYGGQTISLAHLAPFVDISRQKIRKEVEEELDGLDVNENRKHEIIESRLRKEINKGVQTIQYQVVTLLTSNGQTPFISVNMYLGEAKDERTKEDLAMIIEEVLKQRIMGVKNEQGVYITPAFPKLLYFLEEDNIHEDSKYYYLTKLAAQCTAKRMVPDYISEKKMLEAKIDINGNANAYPCMGCTIGTELVNYLYDGKYYVEAFWKMWDRLSKTYKTKHQTPGVEYNLYMDIDGMLFIYDTKKGFVRVRRIIRNTSGKWKRITFEGGRVATVTLDHPFETENRGVVQAKDLTTDDIIIMNYSAIPALDTIETTVEMARLKSMLIDEKNYSIPSEVFSWNDEARLAFLARIINTKSFYSVNDEVHMKMKFTSHELALQFVQLIQSFNCPAGIKIKTVTHDNGYFNYIYEVSFIPTDEMATQITAKVHTTQQEETITLSHPISIEDINKRMNSYDVTTDSGHFEFSGIYSHNCRSFLTTYVDENGNPKYYGRFNQGVVTINLPYAALASKKDIDAFWEILDDYLELCHKALWAKHERLMDTPSDVAPILWQYGAIARLKKGETINKLLVGDNNNFYSTISLGYAGLYETVMYLTGKSHTDPEAKDFALSIMQHLNDKCADWKLSDKIGYSLYGTPLESTTYKFAKALQNDFKDAEWLNDTDKELLAYQYVTNSYHVNVREKIDAYTKLKFESDYQLLSPGGAISYIEVPNMQNNIEAVLDIIKYISDNIIYAELNTKSDYCGECGYDGEIVTVDDGDGKLVWECPRCKNRDHRTLYVARRTCGYIGTNFWNEGRTHDIVDRVLHI